MQASYCHISYGSWNTALGVDCGANSVEIRISMLGPGVTSIYDRSHGSKNTYRDTYKLSINEILTSTTRDSNSCFYER